MLVVEKGEGVMLGGGKGEGVILVVGGKGKGRLGVAGVAVQDIACTKEIVNVLFISLLKV